MAGYMDFLGEGGHEVEVTKSAGVESVLESFYYMNPKKMKLTEKYRAQWKILLDSGAFSAASKGTPIDLERYCGFIKQTASHWDIVAALDVIGDAVGSWTNYQRMCELGVHEAVTLMPAFHFGSPWEELDKVVNSGAPYIALGGLVAQSAGADIHRFLDIAWGEHLTNPDGTPKIKVHGFGVTGNRAMLNYPWESVDSTAWLQMAGHGVVIIDLPDPRGGVQDMKVAFSDQSPKVKEYDQHFDSMRPAWQKQIQEHLEGQGYKIEDLRRSYRWRQHVNIGYYKRCEKRAATKFIRAQPGLFM